MLVLSVSVKIKSQSLRRTFVKHIDFFSEKDISKAYSDVEVKTCHKSLNKKRPVNETCRIPRFLLKKKKKKKRKKKKEKEASKHRQITK